MATFSAFWELAHVARGAMAAPPWIRQCYQPSPVAVSGVGRLPPFFMCIFFSARYLKNPNIDAATIIKLDMEMFHTMSWKSIYFEVKRSRSRVTKTLPAWVFVLLWVLASSSFALSTLRILLSTKYCKVFGRKETALWSLICALKRAQTETRPFTNIRRAVE